AREVVDELFTRVSEDTLLNQPGMQPLRRELLEKALGYYRQFLDQRSNDPNLQDELAVTFFRVGLIIDEIESPEKALQSYERARDMQQKLLASEPDEPRHLEA